MQKFPQTIEDFIELSQTVRTFTSPAEKRHLAYVARGLRDHCNIVEVGSFFGSSAIVLAGARKIMGSGVVCCIDTFDIEAGDDEFSRPFYRDALARAGGGTVAHHFINLMDKAQVQGFIQIYEGIASDVLSNWKGDKFDMAYLDGGAPVQQAVDEFLALIPNMRSNGIIALHNSSRSNLRPGNNGYRVVAEEYMKPPYCQLGYQYETLTIGWKI